MSALLRRAGLALCALAAPAALQAYTLSTTTSGNAITWPARSEAVQINTNACPAGTAEAIQASMNTWSTVPGSTFRFSYAGSTTLSNATYDGNNVCSFRPLGTDGTVARNTITYYTVSGQLLDSDIVFNTYYGWSVTGAAGKFDVQNIATHELAHALALADLYGSGDTEKTMYGYVNTGETKKRTLEPDDIAGIAYLYPFMPAVTLGRSDSPMAESGGTATVTATLSAAAGREVTVALTFSGTATLTSDYVPSTALLTIPAGSLSGSLTLAAVNDALCEVSESVVVDIASVSNGTENATQQVTVMIADDDYAPTITSQPAAQSVAAGGTVTFAVSVSSGVPEVFYQWLFNGEPISGGTHAAHTLVDVQASQAGAYSVRVSNSYATVTSQSALLTVETAVHHYLWTPVATAQTSGVPFLVSITARDAYGALLTSCTNRLSLCGAGSLGPVALPLGNSADLVAGEWAGSVQVDAAGSGIRLTANDDQGHAGETDPFDVLAGPLDHFAWDLIPSPQQAGTPFPATLTARDKSNNTVTGFGGSAALAALQQGAAATNMLGSRPHALLSSGSYTLGYSFTPSENITVTHLRHYFGTKVSIWTDAGLCLVSQSVNSVAGTWTETPLATPVQLTAGVRYRVGAFTGGGSYFRMDGAAGFSHGVIHESLNAGGDAFPASADFSRWWFVDLRYTAGSDGLVALTPTSAVTFASGVWRGAVTVWHSAKNVCLTADDGAGHRGASNLFNSQTAGNTAPMGTPDQWLIQFGLTSESPAAAEMTDSDGDGMPAWQEYVAGTVPTSRDSVFRSVIAISNGAPRVTWTPDLGTSRVYTVEGRARLTSGAWGTTNADSRFFRVSVALP